MGSEMCIRDRFLAGLMVVSAVLSSFLGEHTIIAIMLPIGLAIIKNVDSSTPDGKNAILLVLFSIAYGTIIGSIGTPSGGARNVIMINYFNQSGLSLSYFEWMIKIYPFVIIQIPIVAWIIINTFKPEYKILDSSIRKLVIKVAKSRSMTGRNTVTVIIFILVFLGWIFFSERFVLGNIALTGVFLYILGGFVRWNDLSRHTHWGVIILFGATISLGTSIRSTGAALWLADQVIMLFGSMMDTFPFFSDLIVIMITAAMTNILSSSATGAVLGPITMNLIPDMMHIGLVTAVSSAFGYFTAVAAPACTIVYSSGMIKAVSYTHLTLPTKA